MSVLSVHVQDRKTRPARWQVISKGVEKNHDQIVQCPFFPPYLSPSLPSFLTSSNPVFCIKNLEFGKENLRPFVPAAHKKAPIPVVNPMFIVSISLLMACIVSNTLKAGRSNAPGTLKYM